MDTPEHRPSRLARLRDLRALYDAMPHLADPDYLERYARSQREELIREREAICDADRALTSDRIFVAILGRYEPALLRLARWRVRALALAERRSAIKPTPDEYRGHAAAWSDVEAEDEAVKDERAFRQAVERKLRLARLKDALKREHPEAGDIIDDVWQAFQHVRSDSPPEAGVGRGGPEPEPEVYGP